MHKNTFIKLILLLLSFALWGCSNNGTTTAATTQSVPNGVNLGGMFVLEDWFFSPNTVGHDVATPCTYESTGIASSRIFAQSNAVPDFTWTSETNMIKQFLQNGYTDVQIAALFKSHRDNYLNQSNNGPKTLDENFAKMQSLGITEVRLPITWAITYPDHSYTINPGHGNAVITVPAGTDITLIQDPFYPDLKWASIPVAEIMQVLKAAANHNVKVILDIHAFPGGSSDGTYNGVWPLQPAFWDTGLDSNGQPIYQQNFQTIFTNLISWTESLYTLPDQSYANGLGGLTAMNEPAHLLGIPQARCTQGSWGISSYQNVLDTLSLAVSDFGQSSLPAHGVKLYMNVIETMFPTTMTATEQYSVLGNWWRSVTTANARQTWAILDIHHYFAWDPTCNTCLQDHVSNGIITPAGFAQMKQCSDSWYLTIRSNLRFTAQDLLATSEFSASANQDTFQSCASGKSQPISPSNYQAYRNAILQYQINDAKQAGINAYFWTWMIPYNDNYQNEWALYNITQQNN